MATLDCLIDHVKKIDLLYEKNKTGSLLTPCIWTPYFSTSYKGKSVKII